MGVSRFKQGESPSSPLGKADFEWFYSGSLQEGDDLKIPPKTKIIDVYINRLDCVLKVAPEGGASDGKVIVGFYKNSALIDTVEIDPGDTEGTTSIPLTLVTAGDLMEVAIEQVGLTFEGVTLSAYARVAAT